MRRRRRVTAAETEAAAQVLELVRDDPALSHRVLALREDPMCPMSWVEVLADLVRRGKDRPAARGGFAPSKKEFP
jgi:hypothetical protein